MEKESVVRTYGFIVLCVGLSKILGLLRNMCVAYFYGSTEFAAAFFTASKIPLTLFDITIGTAVAAAFIPVFNKILQRESREEAFSFGNKFLSVMAILGTLVALLLFSFPNVAVFLMSSGYPDSTAQIAAQLLRIMSPVVILAVICYTAVGILQSLGEFRRPALMSVLSNLALLVYFFSLNDRFGIYGLGFALVVGWIFQFIVLLGPLRKFEFKLRPKIDLKDQNLKSVIILTGPVLIASWAQPINSIIASNLASHMDGGRAVVFTENAYQLYFMLAGVFSLALTNIYFPKLSRYFAAGEIKEGKALTDRLLVIISLVVLPIIVFVFIFSKDMVRLIYERGAFTGADTSATFLILSAYVVGMLGLSFQEILNKSFYAMHDSKTPMLVSIVSIGANLIMGIMLIRVIGAVGIAVAATFAVSLQAVLLLIFIKKKTGESAGSFFGSDMIKALFSAGITFAVFYGLSKVLSVPEGFLQGIFALIGIFLIGCLAYTGLLFVFNVKTFKASFSKLRGE